MKKVYQPIRIRNFMLKNRVVQAPAANQLNTDTGGLRAEQYEWVKARAKGGCGIVSVGMSLVNPNAPELGGYIFELWNDKCVNGLFRLGEVIHQFGALASIELVYWDFGKPQAPEAEDLDEDMSKIRTKEGSAINDKSANRTPVELRRGEIKQIINYYVEAAVRCKRAGFDAVLMHGAHGMFISDFLSETRNKRTDGYGGSFENRCRIVDEILIGIREAVGPDMIIEYRLSGEEKTEGGLSIEDQLEFAKHIEDKIDILYVSAGILENDEKATFTFPPAYYKRGINVPLAKPFKDVLSVPVGAVGGIDMPLAEEIVENGDADLVSIMRQTIADPACVNKARKGRHDEIRPCVRCNTCINLPHYFFLPVRCAVNPMAGREADILRIPAPGKSKNVVVIGGGPGGMEAARTAADRGHRVTLIEKKDILGGMIRTASNIPLKKDMKTYLEWAVRETAKRDIKILLSTEATVDHIKSLNPDAIIVAVGSRPACPPIPGFDGANVCWAGDVDNGEVQVGGEVVICGGGLTGLECAFHLADNGKKVTVVEMQPKADVIMHGGTIINMVSLMMMLNHQKVTVLNETKLKEVTPEGIKVTMPDGSEQFIPADNVINAMGMEPQRELAESFRDIAEEVYLIGDCTSKRGNLWQATTAGFLAAMEL